MQDLQSFFADQRPDAVNSTFKVASVAGKSTSMAMYCTTFKALLLPGGLNNQSLADAGDEADLDVQFAFGISHPVSVSGTYLRSPSPYFLI